MNMFICQCHMEAIVAEKCDDEVELAFWSYGQANKGLTFGDKIKLCFRIFTKGTPYTDMVILNKEEGLKLAKFLKDSFKEKVDKNS